MAYDIHNAGEIGRLNRNDMPYAASITAAEEIAGEISDSESLDLIIDAMGQIKSEWADKTYRQQIARNMIDAIATSTSRFRNAYIDFDACPNSGMSSEECQDGIIQSTHAAIAWATAPYPNMMRMFGQFLYNLDEAINESDNEMLAMQHNEEHVMNGQEDCYGCDEYTDEAYGYGGYDYGMTDYGYGGGIGSPAGNADARIEELCNRFIQNVVDYEQQTVSVLNQTVICCNAILNGQITDDEHEPDPYAEWKALGWEEFFD